MLCRLCVFECTEESVNIFYDEEESDLIKLIAVYLHLEIAQDDSFSTKICGKCKEHLEEFDRFFEYIKERQIVLKSVFRGHDQINLIAGQALQDQTTTQMFENNAETLIDFKSNVTEKKGMLGEQDIMPETIEFVATTANDELENCSTLDVNEIDELPFQHELVKTKKIEIEEPSNIKKSKTQTTFGIQKKLFRIDNLNESDKNWKSIAQKTQERDKFIETNAQLKCEICRNISNTYKEFQRHFQEKHNRSPYIKCCGSRLYTRHAMVKHITNHVDPERYKCKFCNKILSSSFNLRAHIGSFHTEKEKLEYGCEICSDRFSSSFVLKTHMLVHGDKSFTCEICNKMFKHSRSLNRHLRLEHGDGGLHICELCGKSYKYKQMFEQHMADKHNIISKSTMKYCAECKCWFSTKYYNKHAEHHKLQDIECKKCGKIFPSKAALIKHRDIHYHTKKCGTCGKAFEKARELKEHIKVHLDQTNTSLS